MSKYAQELEEAERLVNFYEQEETRCESDVDRDRRHYYCLRVKRELLELRLYVYQMLEKISTKKNSNYQSLIQQTKQELQENREQMRPIFQRRNLLKTYPDKKRMATSLVRSLREDQSNSVSIKQYQKR